MNEEDFEYELKEYLECAIEDDGMQFEDAEIYTFDERGILTRNKGLIFRMKDGSEFQLTIVQSRRGG